MIARLLIVPFGNIWKLKCLCQKISFRPVKKVLLFLYRMHQYENGSSIAWNSEFDGEPCFPHGMKSIFISRGARVGRNCVIFQQVTIGSNTLADSNLVGAPVIGDDCYIAAGAIIVGNVRIGNNVRIGANAVVYKDIPDNSVVVSGEQKIIAKENTLDNRFYSYDRKWVYYDNGKWMPVKEPNIIDIFRRVEHE